MMIRELRRMIFLLPLFLFLGAIVYPAYTPAQIGILIVGLEKDDAMKAREKALIESVIAKKREAGPVAQKVKIYSYHFDKEAERAFCESVLKIKRVDLLFLGIVTLNKDGLPGRLLERHYRISNPDEAASEAVAAVVKQLGLSKAKPVSAPTTAKPSKPEETAKPTASPAASPEATARPSASPEATPKPAASPEATPKPAASPEASKTPKPEAASKPTAFPAAKPTVPEKTPAPSVGPSAKKSGEAGAQKPAAAASPAVTKKGERWSLQFGYYANRENAETFLKRFPDDRFLIMEEKQADGTVRWRVLYGDFATKEEALEAEKELQCRAEVLKRQAEEWEKLYEDWKKGNAPFPVTKP